jgi:hypothetical protein
MVVRAPTQRREPWLVTSTESPGQVVQSWVPTELAEELKRHARSERRSVSAVVRLAIEDSLHRDGQTVTDEARRRS